ncbi:MAG: PRC-barrel domain-containing protein [Chloroflexota bacterium]|nr:PRC-barrel domain-containing protein [Chloroflexota bacterium]
MSETEDHPVHPEILKASSPGREQIQPGMDVVSIDGDHIGKVKGVREAEFLIGRPLARDVWVPFTAVIEAGEHGGAFRRGPTQPSEVVLSVSAAHVDEQGWQHA